MTVKNFAEQIQVFNGCTIRKAIKYGRIIEIVGTVPASLAGNNDAFQIPSDFLPSASVLVTPTIRNGNHGVITYNTALSTRFRYYTEATYSQEQNFNVMYII